ncbi:DUF2281 domain-containing protein [Pistricoccus aurantiacus]|uniref:DUF2281 domain-containing protein n=1 Tax=Pistricoccus aurantiacus TaxID=1883414 RepID=UPI003641FC8B
MDTTEQIANEIRRLPEPLRQEVLDFIEFLQAKHLTVSKAQENQSLLMLKGGLESSTTFGGDDVEIQERLRDEWN